MWAEIDLDAVEHNVREIARYAAPARVMPVLKANAYGHGAIPVAKAAIAAGADQIAVACVDEGEELRRGGVIAPILVLTHTPLEDAERAVRLDLTLTIASIEMAEAVARFARESGKTAIVHLKVDTGLHRYGNEPGEALRLANAARSMPGLEVEGIFTHFTSSADEGLSLIQHDRFLEVAAALPWIRVRHAANSGNIVVSPRAYHDAVRPGIMIHGAYPEPALHGSLQLRPTMSLKSRLARIHTVPAGESVGYDSTWHAERPTPVGLVMIGYADGYPRALSNRGVMLLHGCRVPVIGRVSMDATTIDLSEIPDARLEDEVVVLGRQGSEEITIDQIAGLAGTISHEVLSGISARVPRLYLRERRAIAMQTLNGFVEEPIAEAAGR